MKDNTDNISESKSVVKLDVEVKDLIKLITDPNIYNETMRQLNIDSQKLPLGKISSNQIDKAYQILSEIASNLAKFTKKELMEYSSRFYTIIPYASGMSAPPIIDDEHKIKEKIEQLKSLDEMIIAAEKFLNHNIDKLEQKYLSLQCDLEILTNSNEINMVLKYIQNTSAHNFKIDVRSIFKTNRQGESEHFNSFQTLHNRQLLWHGSRLANYVGILSKGLRINPQNVIKTGSMFGNGIYFSNVVTKSVQYTYTDNNALLLLCEVALGNTYELTQAKYITNLPDGYHSTLGMGHKTPRISENLILEDDLIVPLGKLEERNNFKGSLKYDEFIVYNSAQIKIRYLLLVNLH